MPDSGLKKRVGGQPLFAWGLELGGVVVVWIFYRRYQASKAAAATTGTTSGLPALGAGAGTGVTGTGVATTTTPTDIASWVQEAMSGLTGGTGYTQGHFYSDISSWLNGNCVGSQQGYNAISSALETQGLPPGYGVLPLSLCPQTPASTPPAPAPTSGAGSAQAQAAYAQALTNYRTVAQVKGVSLPTLHALYVDVLGAQSVYTGQAGTAAAYAAYRQAYTSYQYALAHHQSSAIPTLFNQVSETMAVYQGHG